MDFFLTPLGVVVAGILLFIVAGLDQAFGNSFRRPYVLTALSALLVVGGCTTGLFV